MGWKWGHEQPITERVFSVFMIVVSNMSQPCACLTLNCLGRHELGTTHHEPLNWWGIRWYSQPWDCATSTSLRKVASKAVKPTNWGSFLGIFDDHLFDYPLLSHIIPIIIRIYNRLVSETCYEQEAAAVLAAQVGHRVTMGHHGSPASKTWRFGCLWFSKICDFILDTHI